MSILGVNTGTSIKISLDNEIILCENVSRKAVDLADKTCLTPSSAYRYPFVSVVDFLECLMSLRDLTNSAFGTFRSSETQKFYELIHLEIDQAIKNYEASLKELNKISDKKYDLQNGFNVKGDHDRYILLANLKSYLQGNPREAVKYCSTREHLQLLIRVGFNVCDESTLLSLVPNYLHTAVFIIDSTEEIYNQDFLSSLIKKPGNRNINLYFPRIFRRIGLSKQNNFRDEILSILVGSDDSSAKELLDIGIRPNTLFNLSDVIEAIHGSMLRQGGIYDGFRSVFSLLFLWYLKNDIKAAMVFFKNSFKVCWPNDFSSIEAIIDFYINKKDGLNIFLKSKDGLGYFLIEHIILVIYRYESSDKIEGLNLLIKVLSLGINPTSVTFAIAFHYFNKYFDKIIDHKILALLFEYNKEKIYNLNYIGCTYNIKLKKINFAIKERDFWLIRKCYDVGLINKYSYEFFYKSLLNAIVYKDMDLINELFDILGLYAIFENIENSHEFLNAAISANYDSEFIKNMLFDGVVKTSHGKLMIEKYIALVVSNYPQYENLFFEASVYTNASVPWDILLHKADKAKDINVIASPLAMGCDIFTCSDQSNISAPIEFGSHVMANMTLLLAAGATLEEMNAHLSYQSSLTTWMNNLWTPFSIESPRPIASLQSMATKTIFKHASLFRGCKESVEANIRMQIESPRFLFDYLNYAMAFLKYLCENSSLAGKANAEASLVMILALCDDFSPKKSEEICEDSVDKSDEGCVLAR